MQCFFLMTFCYFVHCWFKSKDSKTMKEHMALCCKQKSAGQSRIHIYTLIHSYTHKSMYWFVLSLQITHFWFSSHDVNEPVHVFSRSSSSSRVQGCCASISSSSSLWSVLQNDKVRKLGGGVSCVTGMLPQIGQGGKSILADTVFRILWPDWAVTATHTV